MSKYSIEVDTTKSISRLSVLDGSPVNTAYVGYNKHGQEITFELTPAGVQQLEYGVPLNDLFVESNKICEDEIIFAPYCTRLVL